jgi:predicted dehydrogenase
VQIGTQRRSGRETIKARDFIQSGEFGEVNLVQMTSNANQPMRWRRPKLVEVLRKEETDWKRFLMGRTKDEWDAQKYIEFRLYWPYSSGIPCQWMVHQIDAMHFITGLSRPRSVTAQGGVYSWRDGRINPDTVTAIFDYGPLNDPAKGFQVIFHSRMNNSAGGSGDVYHSINGVFNASTGKVSPDGGLTERYAKGRKPTSLVEKSLFEEEKPGVKAESSVHAHMRNWMECIRSRKPAIADIQAGYQHSVALCMTIAAMHSGRRATFDEAKQEVTLTNGKPLGPTA